MFFNFKGINSKGQNIKGQLEATSINEAKKQLKSRNIYYYDLKRSNTFNTILNSRSIDKNILSDISSSLSIYLQSGLTLMESIKLLQSTYKADDRLFKFFESIHNNLKSGQSFYTAVSNQNTFELPLFFVESIKISERSGILPDILKELSNYIKEQQNTSSKIKASMIYPMFILSIALILITFMLNYIVPEIAKIFQNNHQQLPTITLFIINFGNFIKENILYIILATCSFVASFYYTYKNYPPFTYKVDFLLLKMPLIGKIIEFNELANFAYTNSMLLKSGIPFVQTINLSTNVLNNSVIKEIFTMSAHKVVEGQKLSNCLEIPNNRMFKIDKSFIEMLHVAEETGKINIVFENLVIFYREQNSRKIQVILSLLEPLIMVIVGSIIGVIVISMILPIFSMSIG